ncbi:RNA pseudouridine synthase 5 [Apostasia shenzhenica]|uniref:RNA pseudouridine synthase 5 n=1 Tax=Apostasia shenzhenica TaxID=1088818 RepID=A0A2I0B4H2_9ASPA|nr:RNA pseudouridine synthase 5 [Apostasia shenzhenica]
MLNACSVGSELVYLRLPWKEPSAPFKLEVLYEDEDMVAINKPSGLQVLPGGLFQQRTVLTQLQWKEWTRGIHFSSSQAVQEPYPVPVHRLGRGTSGILICAKSKLAKKVFASYFSEGTSVVGHKWCRLLEVSSWLDGSMLDSSVLPATCLVEMDLWDHLKTEPDPPKVRKLSKIYRALVTGILEHNEVIIEQPIGLMHYPGVATGLYVASSEGSVPSASLSFCLLSNIFFSFSFQTNQKPHRKCDQIGTKLFH